MPVFSVWSRKHWHWHIIWKKGPIAEDSAQTSETIAQKSLSLQSLRIEQTKTKTVIL
jgi:hypothetical protein